MVFPPAAYSILIIAGPILPRTPTPAVDMIGAASVALLFIGIHIAWDTVAYMALQRGEEQYQPTR